MPNQTFWNLPEEKREALLEIAIDEFAENDYQNASVSRIVARAGIAKGSFYQYFADKQDLYRYLLDLIAQEKMAVVEHATPPDPQMGFFDYLRWLFRSQAEFELRHPRLGEVAYRAFLREGGPTDEQLQQMKAASQAHFGRLIEQAQARGEIAPTIDPALAAFVLVTLSAELGRFMLAHLDIDLKQVVDRSLLAEDRRRMSQLSENFITILEHGLRGPAASPETDQQGGPT
jgi:TetR/AcrR family transcriptional regulator